MSAIIPFIEGCFIISHDASIHSMQHRGRGNLGLISGLWCWGRTRDLGCAAAGPGWPCVAGEVLLLSGPAVLWVGRGVAGRDGRIRSFVAALARFPAEPQWAVVGRGATTNDAYSVLTSAALCRTRRCSIAPVRCRISNL